LRDRVVPEQAQPEPTAFEAAAADGVEVTLVGAGEYATSGFTRAALRGGRYWRTHSLGDQAAGALRGLGQGRRSLVYLYHPDLDRTGHVRGAGAEPAASAGPGPRPGAWSWPTSTSWWPRSPSACPATPPCSSPATTAWSTCAPSSGSTWPTSPSWPPGSASWPARPGPGTSTPRRAP